MSKKGTAKKKVGKDGRADNVRYDLTDPEINKVFEDLQIPEDQRGRVFTEHPEPQGPVLHFPLTVQMPIQPPIDW